ncbi:hypothetical protein Q3O60_05185 [Alkalimonas collagenimarina]|uniref:Uncharacterized protein n=1 Tax=Alkalimonas collagenimarina TaxID=400390 RepID=A0ABT9GX13_9GAMM|nr:hypothetical protein [Alkalimonas collagenimarina]MDP4535572.1 hypothetical protein [Alkalimonas collagenimarina]
MGTDADSKSQIDLDDYLIEQAEIAFEKLPKSAQELLEHWAWIGKAAAEQLTEEEQLLLLSQSANVKLIVKAEK